MNLFVHSDSDSIINQNHCHTTLKNINTLGFLLKTPHQRWHPVVLLQCSRKCWRIITTVKWSRSYINDTSSSSGWRRRHSKCLSRSLSSGLDVVSSCCAGCRTWQDKSCKKHHPCCFYIDTKCTMLFRFLFRSWLSPGQHFTNTYCAGRPSTFSKYSDSTACSCSEYKI